MDRQAPDYDGKLSVDNNDVARVLNRIADLLEFKDENPFKLRSYRVAAETIAAFLCRPPVKGGSERSERGVGVYRPPDKGGVSRRRTGG